MGGGESLHKSSYTKCSRAMRGTHARLVILGRRWWGVVGGGVGRAICIYDGGCPRARAAKWHAVRLRLLDTYVIIYIGG